MIPKKLLVLILLGVIFSGGCIYFSEESRILGSLKASYSKINSLDVSILEYKYNGSNYTATESNLLYRKDLNTWIRSSGDLVELCHNNSLYTYHYGDLEFSVSDCPDFPTVFSSDILEEMKNCMKKKYLGNIELNGRECYKIECDKGDESYSLWFFDVQTLLPVSVETFQNGIIISKVLFYGIEDINKSLDDKLFVVKIKGPVTPYEESVKLPNGTIKKFVRPYYIPEGYEFFGMAQPFVLYYYKNSTLIIPPPEEGQKLVISELPIKLNDYEKFLSDIKINSNETISTEVGYLNGTEFVYLVSNNRRPGENTRSIFYYCKKDKILIGISSDDSRLDKEEFIKIIKSLCASYH